jgi:hypothetical protein
LHDDSEENVNEDDSDRTNYLSNPSSVVLLAKHVISAHQGAQKWLRSNGKPLVIAVSRLGQSLVAGVPCPSEPGEVVQNPFGRLFHKTAAQIGVSVHPHEFLDSFVIQIATENLQRFLATLSEFFRV